MPFSQAIELIKQLKSLKQTCACAESCTGGRIAAAVTSIPGSSEVFKGGVVSYSNDSKIKLLGVDPDILKELGAVCQDVAEQMAAGARKAFGVDIAVSTTGIAGPDGGSEAKPVGLVFVAWADAGGVSGERFVFSGNRNEIQLAASREALKGMLERLGG